MCVCVQLPADIDVEGMVSVALRYKDPTLGTTTATTAPQSPAPHKDKGMSFSIRAGKVGAL